MATEGFRAPHALPSAIESHYGNLAVHFGQVATHQTVPGSERSCFCVAEEDWEATDFARAPLASFSTPQELSSQRPVIDFGTAEELASLEVLSVSRRKLCLLVRCSRRGCQVGVETR